MKPSFETLTRVADAEVQALLRALPTPLRAAAVPIPVVYDRRPNRRLVADGISPDTMGLFQGSTVTETIEDMHRITLFLDNIWDEAQADVQTFRDEVRATVLHELGHFLGLTEDELFDRDL